MEVEEQAFGHRKIHDRAARRPRSRAMTGRPIVIQLRGPNDSRYTRTMTSAADRLE
jgi:hypothetical protein